MKKFLAFQLFSFYEFVASVQIYQSNTANKDAFTLLGANELKSRGFNVDSVNFGNTGGETNSSTVTVDSLSNQFIFLFNIFHQHFR